MKKKNDIPSIAPLHYQYTALPKDDLPEQYKLIPINFKNKEIEEYEVLFFHRLMKKNYGDPSEIEFEQDSIKRLADGKVMAIGREWKYYLRTRTDGIIQIGTEDVHTRLMIYHVLLNNLNEPSQRLINEGKKFVNDLLREAQRLKGQVLNIKKEFETNEKIKLSLLHNVFLTNYRSAELMLEFADENEQILKDEFLRYDARNSLDPEQKAHIDKFMPALGMYYAASISYFFMSLEGFVNILYYVFLKDELRSEFFKEQKLNERLDINAKILLMPSLCNGFKNKQKTAFLKDLTILKNYRNFFFHSKIADSLKRATFVESGFLYTCNLEKDSSSLFPWQKHHLSKKDVLEFKRIVDSIIKDILEMMQEQYMKLVDKYVMNSLELPFWYDANGEIKFGFK
jgi:hypothetical protein